MACKKLDQAQQEQLIALASVFAGAARLSALGATSEVDGRLAEYGEVYVWAKCDPGNKAGLFLRAGEGICMGSATASLDPSYLAILSAWQTLLDGANRELVSMTAEEPTHD